MEKVFEVPTVNYMTADDIIQAFQGFKNIKPGTQIKVIVPDDNSVARNNRWGISLPESTRTELQAFIAEHALKFGGDMSMQQIAKRFQVSNSTVSDYVRKMAAGTAVKAAAIAAV